MKYKTLLEEINAARGGIPPRYIVAGPEARRKLGLQRSRPILFKARMVRSILDDIKTETRRVMRIQPNKNGFIFSGLAKCDDCGDKFQRAPKRCKCGCTYFKEHEIHISKLQRGICPSGRVGDLLWVKETWSVCPEWNKTKPSRLPDGLNVHYLADGEPQGLRRTRSPLFMQKRFSRIRLEIEDVKAERIQEITRKSALAEGAAGIGDFKRLWESIHGGTKNKWANNPWVWVIKFKKL